MIAEILLVLAGHPSSLFLPPATLLPAFAPLLHPGEIQCLEALALLAHRYNKVKVFSNTPPRNSEYVSSVCATLRSILGEYEQLVVDTEAKVLRKDDAMVARGSFVPLASIKATFAEWDAPLAALEVLVDDIRAGPRPTPEVEPPNEAPSGAPAHWPPGPLIDLLLHRAQTGVQRIAVLFSQLAVAAQRLWQIHLTAFLVHGALAPSDALAKTSDSKYHLNIQAIPSCVSSATRESIAYVGRAVATVEEAEGRGSRAVPRDMRLAHTKMLEGVLPQDVHRFDKVVAEIRTNVSEWLWTKVLSRNDVYEAVESLANYFLLRNGEFGVSLIREIERLKASRLTPRAMITRSGMIREQDLSLALLRASLGTSAQHDPSLSRLHFSLPSGPLRPLLPSLSHPNRSANRSANASTALHSHPTFDDLLLGTPLKLTYKLTWPLDLFLVPADLNIYSTLFSYLSAIRHAHARVLECWSSLSNAQRVRRRWTGLGEGGTEDGEGRRQLLRCGWGVMRELIWFLDTLWAHIMTDVVDVQFRKLKAQIHPPSAPAAEALRSSQRSEAPLGDGNDSDGDDAGVHLLSPTSTTYPSGSTKSTAPAGTTSTSGPSPLANATIDFTTLRALHSTYLLNVLSGSLLSHPGCAGIIRSILEVCDRFVAQVERWGGDVLPALLFEGSLGGPGSVGEMVRERWEIVREINETLNSLLESFYEALSLSTSQPLSSTADASSAMLNISTTNTTTLQSLFRPRGKGKRSDTEADGEARRHIEHLLLRLDFNAAFSEPTTLTTSAPMSGEGILKQGGL
ncbi:hypothetical protein BOTBODRAFT_158048 [Botryobasidium botryosum FD-172 SS1]|uniref:Spindle pole body component n=1 Tax=Botryobasidium botryosum (strain FD-172 SS1) TaxID=930990 RepID=A0A067MIX0_BOTB1|nr:hypothetical protein BOTBODRAFT_158048 [Botryobasidium botryosum FD-172 SS1]